MIRGTATLMGSCACEPGATFWILELSCEILGRGPEKCKVSTIHISASHLGVAVLIIVDAIVLSVVA